MRHAKRIMDEIKNKNEKMILQKKRVTELQTIQI